MEISNLSDAEFKTLVIRVLQELIGYFNSIKKNQAAMKVTICEIKKNLQGTNSGGDKAKNQINDQEQKEGKSIQSEQQEENIFFKLRRFSFIIFSNKFSISCSFSAPSGTCMIKMLVCLKLFQKILSLSLFFWILFSSCFSD